MLKEYDLFGNVYDKVEEAITIAKTFEPKDGEGYYLAYSGGKDSVCVKRILDMAGVKYDTHYAATTVDPPELVRFIISQFKYVVYDLPDGSHRNFAVPNGKLRKTDEGVPSDGSVTIHFRIPEKNMMKLIPEYRMPPTRLARYCCEELKEVGGKYRKVVTGVRKAESRARKKGHGDVTITNGKFGVEVANEIGADYKESSRGGIILNYDNAGSRILVDRCVRTCKVMINPIVEWEDDDIWEFIHRENIPYCKLYDEGFTRIGCIGCPMGNAKQQVIQFRRWPQYRKVYLRAFGEMIKLRDERGLDNTGWETPEDVMTWWLGKSKKAVCNGQVKLEEMGEE